MAGTTIDAISGRTQSQSRAARYLRQWLEFVSRLIDYKHIGIGVHGLLLTVRGYFPSSGL
jgi:hypothetical protein